MEERVLITAEETKRLARGQGLAAGVLEKDYALTWLLSGIYSEDSKLRDVLSFKGGTAIRKAYFPTWRLSEDLDFTMNASRTPLDLSGGRNWGWVTFPMLLREGFISSVSMFPVCDSPRILRG